MLMSLFQWWYGHGWKTALEHAKTRIIRAYRLFSLPVLLRTLVAPWRRIITAPGAGLDAHIRALTDNFVSRIIGFFVRFFVLFTAGLVIAASVVVSFLEVISWPLIPLLVPLLLIGGALS